MDTSTLRDIDVDTSLRRRMEYAHDASNYRIAPLAVAFPRTPEAIERIVTACAAQGVPVTARGGGTSMAGNAVGGGMVIDLSRHLTAVSIDPAAKTATVQAGIVLDALRRAAAPHGLTFGPDPSSHSRCTLGGMIGNDACGNHSVAFGRTVDHVLELSVVLADGTPATVRRDGIDGTPTAGVEAKLREIGTRYADEIRAELNRFGRQVSGYPLHHLLPESIDLAKSLVGTEGTCAVVTGATLNLVPAATAPTLVVAGYDDVLAAAAEVPAILEHGPTAIEGMDEAVVRMLHGDGPAQALRRLPAGRAWLLIEVDRPTAAASQQAADEIRAVLTQAREARVVADAADQRRLWTIREDGAGLAARSPDGRAYWPGWEDAAVPPDALAGYLADFLDRRRRVGLSGAIYGHFGAGCIHTRIDFDRATEPGRAIMDGFLHDAARLVVRHGGSLSGEHGDGRARSALLPLMYSPALLKAFEEVKAAWDPRETLNPRIVVRAEPLTAHLDRLVPDHVGRCVGIAKCRSAVGGTMCPSYRATGDERDSTRGRARVLQELLDGAEPGSADAILDALDLCLSCKACSSDCPTGVDMATYKSDFLHRHYRRRLRPASHLSLGWAPVWFRLAARVPAVANLALKARFGLRLAGVTAERSMPRFARAASWAPPGEPRSVVLVDTFTGSFRPNVITALRAVLDDAGLPAAAAKRTACCALPWISTGQLGIARQVLRRTVRLLDGSELPIVVPEPSCASALREDLPRLLPGAAADRIAGRVHTLAGVLAEHAPQWTPSGEPSTVPSSVVQQVHCHEYATFGGDQGLGRFGVTAERAEGCCGLAGNFGFERTHYDVSMKVAEHGLAPLLDRRPDAPLLADGFSCLLQAAHVRGRKAMHLAEYLDEYLDDHG